MSNMPNFNLKLKLTDLDFFSEKRTKKAIIREESQWKWKGERGKATGEQATVGCVQLQWGPAECSASSEEFHQYTGQFLDSCLIL